jgi:hypothetical protein
VARGSKRAFVLLVATAVTVAVIAFFLWPRPESAEARARDTAKALACNVPQHGLGVRPCSPITEFRKLGSTTWRVRIAHVHGCFLVHGDGETTLRACKLQVHS